MRVVCMGIFYIGAFDHDITQYLYACGIFGYRGVRPAKDVLDHSIEEESGKLAMTVVLLSLVFFLIKPLAAVLFLAVLERNFESVAQSLSCFKKYLIRIENRILIHCRERDISMGYWKGPTASAYIKAFTFRIWPYGSNIPDGTLGLAHDAKEAADMGFLSKFMRHLGGFNPPLGIFVFLWLFRKAAKENIKQIYTSGHAKNFVELMVNLLINRR